MTLKTLLVTLPLIIGPAVAFAQGCHGDRADQQAMSCVDGAVWDTATGACVTVPPKTS